MADQPNDTTAETPIATTATEAPASTPAQASPDTSAHEGEGDAHEGEGDEAEGEAAGEGAAAEGGAPAEGAKKKRRRRRKKKGAGEGAAAGAEGGKPEGGPPAPRKDLPLSRFFDQGGAHYGRGKSPFTAGDIVGGRVAAIERGVAVIDLFGRGYAFALSNESRTLPVAPAEPEEHHEQPAEGAHAEGAEAAHAEGAEAAHVEAAAVEAAPAEAPHEAAEEEHAPSVAGTEEAPADEAASAEPELEVGQVFRGRVASVAENGTMAIANRSIIRAEARAKLAKAREEHKRVFGIVFGYNRGGFDVLVEGLRAFCPVSGMTLEHLDSPDPLIGQRLEFSVQAAKGGHQGIVVSRRSIIEREQRKRAKELRKSLSPGMKMKGRVTQVRDFGIFVDLGGVEGLVHMSEVSWDRTVRPEQAAKPGDEVEVQILRIGEGPPGRRERENKGEDSRESRREERRKQERIALSLKACQPDPWQTQLEGLDEGTAHKGKITRTTEFGAFVELAPGVEGLLHISEIGRDLRHANERVKEGEDIVVVVERIDRKAHRISLSRMNEQDAKAFLEGTLETTTSGGKAVRPGAHLKVKVSGIESAGVLVQIEGVIGRRGRGFIPNAEMGTERGTDHRKKFPIGTEVDVKVVGIDRDGGWRLSRKGFAIDEERRAIQDYRREASQKGFGTFGDLLRNKLQPKA
jgi:small subunit ribosomal protein S1